MFQQATHDEENSRIKPKIISNFCVWCESLMHLQNYVSNFKYINKGESPLYNHCPIGPAPPLIVFVV